MTRRLWFVLGLLAAVCASADRASAYWGFGASPNDTNGYIEGYLNGGGTPTAVSPSTPLPVQVQAGSATIGAVTVGGSLPAGTNSIGAVTVGGSLPAGTNSIGTVTVGGALPAGTNSIGAVTVGGSLPAGTNNIGQTTPGVLTVVPLDIASVTTGGVAVTALNAGHATAGGVLVTANPAGMCVSLIGAAGTVTSGNTICVAANQPYYVPPTAGAVSANSTSSSVLLAGNGLQ